MSSYICIVYMVCVILSNGFSFLVDFLTKKKNVGFKAVLYQCPSKALTYRQIKNFLRIRIAESVYILFL